MKYDLGQRCPGLLAAKFMLGERHKAILFDRVSYYVRVRGMGTLYRTIEDSLLSGPRHAGRSIGDVE